MGIIIPGVALIRVAKSATRYFTQLIMYKYCGETYRNSLVTKIIYLMITPVDRACSHYVHRYLNELYKNNR